MTEQALVFASFGSSHESARTKNIDAVANVLASAFDTMPLVQCYTSGMVCRILEKRGIHVPEVPAALLELSEKGIEQVLIQPGLLLPGEEYDKLCRAAEAYRHLFEDLQISTPLLARTEDLHTLADIIASQYPRTPETALVLMGHGTPALANAVYAALDYRFKDIERDDIFIGTVEAYPGLETVMRALEGKGFSHIVLAPLMQVAGDHAKNDMAGDDEDSWAGILRASGYTVECRLVGLGEIPAVQEMYVAHARQCLDTRGDHGV